MCVRNAVPHMLYYMDVLYVIYYMDILYGILYVCVCVRNAVPHAHTKLHLPGQFSLVYFSCGHMHAQAHIERHVQKK